MKQISFVSKRKIQCKWIKDFKFTLVKSMIRIIFYYLLLFTSRLAFAIHLITYLATTNLFPPLQHHLAVTFSTCSVSDWFESFKRSGLSKCGEDNLFITGFYRLNPPADDTSDPISLLEQARCCSSIPEFRVEDRKCESADWKNSLNK